MMLTTKQIEERTLGIGGSDMPIILGLSTYKTPYELYLEKTGQAKSSQEMTEGQYIGHLLEPIIRNEFCKRNNVAMETPDTIVHPTYTFLRANIDGFIKEWNAVFEAKCANEFKGKEWGEDGTDSIPLPYLVQVAHYCIVTNAQEAYIMVFLGELKFKQYRYVRDLQLECRIIEEAQKFWNSVQNNIPPQPVNIDDLRLKYAKSEEKPIVIGDKITAAVENLIQTKRTISELLKTEEKAKFEIMSYMEEHDCLIDTNNNKIATWKSNKNGVRNFRLTGV
jgi:putative phage-type endonuclease